MKSLLCRVLEVYEWELSQLPFVDSVIGRHIYICIARELLSGNTDIKKDISIKRQLSTAYFTDRAIRLKIREMEDKGYLISEMGLLDKRSRVIRPTEKLSDLIYEHARCVASSVSRDIHIIRKGNDNDVI